MMSNKRFSRQISRNAIIPVEQQTGLDDNLFTAQRN